MQKIRVIKILYGKFGVVMQSVHIQKHLNVAGRRNNKPSSQLIRDPDYRLTPAAYLTTTRTPPLLPAGLVINTNGQTAFNDFS